MEWEDKMESGQQQESEDKMESGQQQESEDEVESGQQQESEDGDLEAERLLRLPEVLRLVGLAKSTVYDLINDGLFPTPVIVGRRSVAWPTRVIVTWIKKRPRRAR